MEIAQVSLQDNSLLFYVYIYLVNGSLVEPDRGKNTKKRVFRGQSPCNFPYRMECRGRWLSRP